MLVGLAGIAVLALGMSHALDTGTCGSGGPYVIDRPCPHESALWGVMLMAGLPIWMAGMFISKHGLVEPGGGQIVWTLGFAGGGIALLVKVLLEPSLSSGAKLGALIMAGIFIPLGLAVAVVGVIGLRRRGRGAER